MLTLDSVSSGHSAFSNKHRPTPLSDCLAETFCSRAYHQSGVCTNILESREVPRSKSLRTCWLASSEDSRLASPDFQLLCGVLHTVHAPLNSCSVSSLIHTSEPLEHRGLMRDDSTKAVSMVFPSRRSPLYMRYIGKGCEARYDDDMRRIA